MKKGSGAGLDRRDIARHCLQCQCEFWSSLRDIGKGWGKYCSHQCRNDARASVSLARRIWTKVKRGEGCWPFIGRTTRLGYGAIGIRRRNGTSFNLFAHRVSWELANGPIPVGMFVCHHCDNPPCVRPDHLFLGTALDNAQDASRKGRCAKQNWTHCKRGHEFTKENTLNYRGRQRRCRTCQLANQREHFAKKRKALTVL